MIKKLTFFLLTFLLLALYGNTLVLASSELPYNQFTQTSNFYYYGDTSGIHQVHRDKMTFSTLIEGSITQLFAKDDDYIIFTYTNQPGLFIYYIDEKKLNKIYNTSVMNFVTDGTDVFLVDRSDYLIHKISLQGNELSKSPWITNISDTANTTILYSNSALYINDTLEGIMKVDVNNGYKKTVLVKTEESITDFFLTNDNIYYISPSNCLYSYHLDTEMTTLLDEETIAFMNDGTELYALTLGNDSNLMFLSTLTDGFPKHNFITYKDTVYTLSTETNSRELNYIFKRPHITSRMHTMKKLLDYNIDKALDAPYKKLSLVDEIKYVDTDLIKKDITSYYLDLPNKYMYKNQQFHYVDSNQSTPIQNNNYVITDSLVCLTTSNRLLPLYYTESLDEDYIRILSSLKDLQVVSIEETSQHYKVKIKFEDWNTFFSDLNLIPTSPSLKDSDFENLDIYVYYDKNIRALSKLTITGNVSGLLHDIYRPIKEINTALSFEFYDTALQQKYRVNPKDTRSLFSFDSGSDTTQLKIADSLTEKSPLNAYAFYTLYELDKEKSYKFLSNFNKTYPNHPLLMLRQIELEYELGVPLTKEYLNQLMSFYSMRNEVYLVFLSDSSKYKIYFGEDIPYKEWLTEYSFDSRLVSNILAYVASNDQHDLVISIYKEYQQTLSTSTDATSTFTNSCLASGRIGELNAIVLNGLDPSTIDAKYLVASFHLLHKHKELYDYALSIKGSPLYYYIIILLQDSSLDTIADLKKDLKPFQQPNTTISMSPDLNYEQLDRASKIKLIEETIDRILNNTDYKLNVTYDPTKLTLPTSSVEIKEGANFDYINIGNLTHASDLSIRSFLNGRDVTDKTLILDLQALSYSFMPELITKMLSNFLGECTPFSVSKHDGTLQTFKTTQGYYSPYKEIIVLVNNKTMAPGQIIALALKKFRPNVHLVGTMPPKDNLLNTHSYYISEGIELTLPIGKWIIGEKDSNNTRLIPDIKMESPTLAKILELLSK